jgi:hypothetical protein
MLLHSGQPLLPMTASTGIPVLLWKVWLLLDFHWLCFANLWHLWWLAKRFYCDL